MKEAVKPLETIGLEIANKGLAWLNSAEAFTKEQLPDFAEQVITYEVVANTVAVTAGIICTGIAFKCLLNVLAESKKPEYKRAGTRYYDRNLEAHVNVPEDAPKREECQDEVRCVVNTTTAIVLSLAGVIMILANTSDLIKAAVAPKVYLLEYFTSLLK